MTNAKLGHQDRHRISILGEQDQDPEDKQNHECLDSLTRANTARVGEKQLMPNWVVRIDVEHLSQKRGIWPVVNMCVQKLEVREMLGDFRAGKINLGCSINVIDSMWQ